MKLDIDYHANLPLSSNFVFEEVSVQLSSCRSPDLTSRRNHEHAYRKSFGQ